ncbi:myb protein, variant [Capsaspora owczarzaki ATCC 30864]|uniref:Myb protein, variant n=1 Tax=Capsaspora owczarzaki (strain ATCC 30864) TaxID=595528 RepID=A0A0D2X0A2_CAPO3|nr:myb protein, variant [Capsaspora owczarzaki ATCC 30864]
MSRPYAGFPENGVFPEDEPDAAPWTDKQDAELRYCVDSWDVRKDWTVIAARIPPHTAMQCARRWQKLNPQIVRGSWTPEEDLRVIQLVDQIGACQWPIIASFLIGRIGKQCRERYHNHLNPNIKKDPWSTEEDNLLLELHEQFGNKWAEIAKHMEGRTDNAIKNRYNSTVSRRAERIASGHELTRPPKPKTTDLNSSMCGTPSSAGNNFSYLAQDSPTTTSDELDQSKLSTSSSHKGSAKRRITKLSPSELAAATPTLAKSSSKGRASTGRAAETAASSSGRSGSTKQKPSSKRNSGSSLPMPASAKAVKEQRKLDTSVIMHGGNDETLLEDEDPNAELPINPLPLSTALFGDQFGGPANTNWTELPMQPSTMPLTPWLNRVEADIDSMRMFGVPAANGTGVGLTRVPTVRRLPFDAINSSASMLITESSGPNTYGDQALSSVSAMNVDASDTATAMNCAPIEATTPSRLVNFGSMATPFSPSIFLTTPSPKQAKRLFVKPDQQQSPRQSSSSSSSSLPPPVLVFSAANEVTQGQNDAMEAATILESISSPVATHRALAGQGNTMAQPTRMSARLSSARHGATLMTPARSSQAPSTSVTPSPFKRAMNQVRMESGVDSRPFPEFASPMPTKRFTGQSTTIRQPFGLLSNTSGSPFPFGTDAPVVDKADTAQRADHPQQAEAEVALGNIRCMVRRNPNRTRMMKSQPKVFAQPSALVPVVDTGAIRRRSSPSAAVAVAAAAAAHDSDATASDVAATSDTSSQDSVVFGEMREINGASQLSLQGQDPSLSRHLQAINRRVSPPMERSQRPIVPRKGDTGSWSRGWLSGVQMSEEQVSPPDFLLLIFFSFFRR